MFVNCFANKLMCGCRNRLVSPGRQVNPRPDLFRGRAAARWTCPDNVDNTNGDLSMNCRAEDHGERGVKSEKKGPRLKRARGGIRHGPCKLFGKNDDASFTALAGGFVVNRQGLDGRTARQAQRVASKFILVHRYRSKIDIYLFKNRLC